MTAGHHSFVGAMVLGLVSFAAYDLSLPILVIGTLTLSAFGCAYFALGGPSVVAIFGRALLALLPVAGLGGGIVYYVIAVAKLDDAEIRALIAATVVAGGWIVTFVTSEMRQTSIEQERRRDMIEATLVEIKQIIAATEPTDWDAIEKATKGQFFKNRGYQIFVMYSQQFNVLSRLVERIETLNKKQISPVMALFQLLERLTEMETRMGTDAFQALPWQRREDMVVRYIDLQRKVPQTASKAEMALTHGPFKGWLRWSA